MKRFFRRSTSAGLAVVLAGVLVAIWATGLRRIAVYRQQAAKSRWARWHIAHTLRCSASSDRTRKPIAPSKTYSVTIVAPAISGKNLSRKLRSGKRDTKANER